MEKIGKISGVNGPVIYVKDQPEFMIGEMVLVGDLNLVGEVITITSEFATVEVYEDTTGLKPGDLVKGTGSAMAVTLGPGIVSNIFDGIERPLGVLGEMSGKYIGRGFSVSSLDEEKKYDTTMLIHVGDTVFGGKIIATVPEGKAMIHKVMIPPNISGTVTYVAENGAYKIWDKIAEVTDHSGKKIDITMAQKWPIRIPRPIHKRENPSIPLVSGQRIIDSLFPLAKGGTAAIPGGFGTGKTMTQHQLAKWCDADLIVYIGCGERGNEMTEVLEDFQKLVDPKSGNLLLDRTVLIANTSNMPVAAREASIYTGITLAEYYRDMGYHVAIMADSTSRWAEALRELSGRLEEMPAEEGFPAYLASRLSSFYERAGYVQNLNGTDGSVTIIGAVSPQGGDFSEPVTQNTKRFVRCFYALDKSLAYARHFPAINWLNSYSEYLTDLEGWYRKELGEQFILDRNEVLRILTEESKLNEIVKLIGSDVLPDDQKLTLEIARVIRLGFIQQNAFHKIDTYVPLRKQMLMMDTILYLYQRAKELIKLNMPMSYLKENPIFDEIIGMKYEVDNEDETPFKEYHKKIDDFYHHFIETNA